ncbi:succinate dehydrogenase, hydrophobic membrane anchor protein [Legionella cincinnatiensis]|uniref:Succinate dehydrogenase hydrophobic membrane anchor subunit n=1 Tax=Legionella cincinnatiensis TaxID=28085 RepID=A0A378IP63_9GAMM|nr:succinate dehydrogenase, hydrophobic membrane anchor protein [Legionella cincinnatiensis]KTC83309.1 succinate dehydrogenase, hydrophobic membrane anchor protein [Legionella cincinnatiensis]STX36720.1 succinate dehydrogenase, hydrophobic membrane anchor protein [Legionella cincinnatiensis]
MVNKLITEMSLTGNGLRDWLVQRFSALIVAAYFLVLFGFFILHPHLNYLGLRQFFSTTWMQVFTLIALLSLFVHAWIGIWTVITDYINPIVPRLSLQVLVILTLFIYFFWGVEILWKLLK